MRNFAKIITVGEHDVLLVKGFHGDSHSVTIIIKITEEFDGLEKKMFTSRDDRDLFFISFNSEMAGKALESIGKNLREVMKKKNYRINKNSN